MTAETPPERAPDAGTPHEPAPDRDAPFAPPPGTSPRGARALSVVAFCCAAGALWLPLLGVVGMVTGTLGNLKGDRPGIVAAVAAGVTTVVGLALMQFVR